jgi:hypothetical protein
LVESGFRFLADDVSPVIIEDGVPTVLPAYPQRKICLDVCGALGVDPAGRPVIDVDRQKIAIRNDPLWLDSKLPLRGVIFLNRGGDDTDISAEKIEGRKKLFMLMSSLYRVGIHLKRGVKPAMMKELLIMASTADVISVKYPGGLDTIRETAKDIIETVRKL